MILVVALGHQDNVVEKPAVYNTQLSVCILDVI